MSPSEFVESVKPLLEAQDLEGLLSLLKEKWPADEIAGLLSCADHDARKVAALALSLVGGAFCIRDLAERLKDPDPMTNQMAEHALWSIWFRCGSVKANHQLARGAMAINRGCNDDALRHFDRAIELCPDFAEPYNQRGIAHYLMERYEECIDDCRRAVDLMPSHFGAWASMGHCYAHLGKLDEAIDAYDRALEVNPHLSCIREALAELNKSRPARDGGHVFFGGGI